jgi:hypothetical protein
VEDAALVLRAEVEDARRRIEATLEIDRPARDARQRALDRVMSAYLARVDRGLIES